MELGYFLVAFIDLLGQRDHLRRLTELPNAADRNDPIVTAFRNSWGAVDGLRRCFLEALREITLFRCRSEVIESPRSVTSFAGS